MNPITSTFIYRRETINARPPAAGPFFLPSIVSYLFQPLRYLVGIFLSNFLSTRWEFRNWNCSLGVKVASALSLRPRIIQGAPSITILRPLRCCTQRELFVELAGKIPPSRSIYITFYLHSPRRRLYTHALIT